MAARPGAGAEARAGEAESAPAPKPPAPKMTLPDPKAKPRRVRRDAPASRAQGRSQRPGPSRPKARRRPRRGRADKGFAGLSSGGGGDNGGVTTGCRRLLLPGVHHREWWKRIEQNWNNKQDRVGVTTMMFTIRRNGRIEGIRLEKASGFPALDQEAERALRSRRGWNRFRTGIRIRHSPSTLNLNTRSNDTNI